MFNYFNNYWINTISPEGFSVFGRNHRTNNFVESFHSSLLGFFGVHPPLWKFYGKYKEDIGDRLIINYETIVFIIYLYIDLLRKLENMMKVELVQMLNSQQVCIQD